MLISSFSLDIPFPSFQFFLFSFPSTVSLILFYTRISFAKFDGKILRVILFFASIFYLCFASFRFVSFIYFDFFHDDFAK